MTAILSFVILTAYILYAGIPIIINSRNKVFWWEMVVIVSVFVTAFLM